MDKTEVWKLSLITDDIDAMDIALEPYMPLALGWDNVKGQTKLDAYFEVNPNIDVHTLPPHTDFICEPVPSQDWVAYGQKSLPLIYAPPFLICAQHNRPEKRGSYHIIEIEAAQAFGTGHHATTQHCLALLAYHFRYHSPVISRVADIGCGAGILSIAAAKLGVPIIYASDYDPLCVQATKENARHNHTQGIKSFLCAGVAHPDYITAPAFDLIMANILANPLRALAKDFTALLGDDSGSLILSGILETQARRILTHYRQFGFIPRKIMNNDGWTSLYLTR